MYDDFMEIGDGLIPIENGWFVDKMTGNKIDPQGRIFDLNGEMIYEPQDEEYDH